MIARRLSHAKSARICLLVLLLAFVPANGAEKSFAEQNRPVGSGFSALSASSPDLSADPSQASANCLKQDDTACAVAVWEHQFSIKPYDDQTRQDLYAALLLHCLRSIDKGELASARAALKRAKEIVPASASYQYFDDALGSFSLPLYQNDMTSKSGFAVSNTADVESRFADIPGILGGQTSVFAITAKTQGSFNFFRLPIPQISATNLVVRFEMFPFSATGGIHAIFGYKSASDYYDATIFFDFNKNILVDISHWTGSGWEEIARSQYLVLSINQWHSVEVRITGQTVQVWIDLKDVLQGVALDYAPGELGIGAGLNLDSPGNPIPPGSTFSVAFDDLVIYKVDDSVTPVPTVDGNGSGNVSANSSSDDTGNASGNNSGQSDGDESNGNSSQ